MLSSNLNTLNKKKEKNFSNLENIKKVNYLIFFIIVIHFFFAFLINENAGGGKIDEMHILNNFKLFKDSNFFEINWARYESTSLPLIYIFYNFIIDTSVYNNIIALNLVISLSAFFLFYLCLDLVFTDSRRDENLLIASCLLLSPYFRTSTFFALEENTAIFFTSLGLYFFLKLKKNFNYPTLILTLLFLSLSIYSRSNYIIIYIIIFFSLVDFKNIFSKNNFFIFFLSILFSIPGFYFLNKWGGIVPPLAVNDRTVGLSNYTQIPIALNLLLIYIIPFFLLEFKKFISIFSYKKLLLFLACLPIYYFIFQSIEINHFAGGAINKLLFLLFSESYIQYITIFISYISLILVCLLFQKKNIILSFIFLSVFLLSFLEFVFQEYFDPILLILFFLFGNLNSLKETRSKYFLVSYFYLFLFSALFFQYQIA